MAESMTMTDTVGTWPLRAADIMARAKVVEGRSRRRNLPEADAQAFIDLCVENPGKRVRVYANEGFVANAYGHSQITYVERMFLPSSQEEHRHQLFEHVTVTRGHANRKYGRGELRIVASQTYVILT